MADKITMTLVVDIEHDTLDLPDLGEYARELAAKGAEFGRAKVTIEGLPPIWTIEP